MDCQIGYNFTPNWAAEMDTGLIVSRSKIRSYSGLISWSVDFVEVPIMANVIYTQPLGRHFSAYVGGGVGGAFSNYENEFGGTTAAIPRLPFRAWPVSNIRSTNGGIWA